MSSRSRARKEDGFTLVELLVAMPIGLIVLFIAFDVLANTWVLNAKVTARQDALQRGRLTMELITRQVRSSVCLSVVMPARAIVEGSDSSMTFFTDLGDGSVPPQRRRLYLDAQAGRIMQVETDGVGSPPVFSATPSRTKILMDGATTSPGVPLWRYFAYSGGVLSATPLPTPLSPADAARTSDVGVTFVATARAGAGSRPVGATFTNDVFSRTVDPMNSKAGQACA